MNELDEVVLDARQAAVMNREQALRTLAQHGSDEDKKMATLLLAGPILSLQDEIRLNDWLPLPTPLAVAVHRALRNA